MAYRPLSPLTSPLSSGEQEQGNSRLVVETIIQPMCLPANLGIPAVSSHPLVFSRNPLETDTNLPNSRPQTSQALFTAHSTGKNRDLTQPLDIQCRSSKSKEQNPQPLVEQNTSTQQAPCMQSWLQQPTRWRFLCKKSIRETNGGPSHDISTWSMPSSPFLF